MFQLILLRHAQALLPTITTRDFDRSLSAAGEADAAQQAERLASDGIIPDMVLHSTARRTTQTAQIFHNILCSPSTPIIAVDALYRADISGYLQEIHTYSSNQTKCLLLVGHNPSIEDLALMFGKNGDRHLLQRLERGYPTAGLAAIHSDDPLTELDPYSAELKALWQVRR